MQNENAQNIGFIQQSNSGQMPCSDRTSSQHNKSSGIKYFSMFTGVGGFEKGIGDKAECVGFSEIDKYANQLLADKFPEVRNYGDATKINASELPEFDMLCGGFPCQSFSIAGKRRGFQDTRGTMFFHIARILEVKRPKIVWLENVKGLLNHDKGETFRVIIQTLSELGYDVQWMVLNSKFHGVPQNRERVFIIGSLRGEPRPEVLPFRTNNQEIAEQLSSQVSNTISARYFKQGNADTYVKRFVNSESQADRINSPEGISPTIPTATGGRHTPMIVQPCQLVNKNRAEKPYNPDNREMKFKIRNDETSYTVKQAAHEFMVAIPVLTPDRAEKRQNGRRFKENGDPAFTITKQDIHGVSDGSKIRRLTPTECERLQGFPDGWTEGFSDTQRYKMMGNAVTVNVIKAIANKLKFVFDGLGVKQ